MSFAEKARPWFFAIAAISSILYVMLELGWRLLISRCPIESSYEVAGISGHDFEVRLVDCFTPFVAVFISRPGGGKKTLLLQYRGVGFPKAEPVFGQIDEHTVRISVPIAGYVDCLQEKWGTVRIEYDLGKVENRDPPACLR